MGKPIRRVVTTHEANGKAVVLFDGTPKQHTAHPELGVESSLLWVTHSSPAKMDGSRDRGDIKIAIPPPANGTIFRIVDFHPMTREMEKLDASHMASSMGDGHARSGKAWKPRHPGMHRTKSVDYAIVMAGEIDMLLDDSEIHLKAGDVLVQQGTNHAWVNRGKETCRIAFILVDADDPLA
jgi:mannose-6-phosphate isomerase-like protein (cupin superfamily)